MTLITWQDGGPLFKDGKIGSEQGCCCGCACPLYVSVRAPFGWIGVPGDVGNPACGDAESQCGEVQAHYEWMLGLLQDHGYSILSHSFSPLNDGSCGFEIEAQCCLSCWLQDYWGNPYTDGNFVQAINDFPDNWISAYSYNGGPPVVSWIGFCPSQNWLPINFFFYKVPVGDVNEGEYWIPPLIADGALPDFAEGYGYALPICGNPLP